MGLWDFLGIATLIILVLYFGLLAAARQDETEKLERLKGELERLLAEEREKTRQERENRLRVEQKLSETHALLENEREEKEEIQARLAKLWEETARLKKPIGKGPKNRGKPQKGEGSL